MAAIVIQSPTFAQSGAQKEPDAFSIPPTAGASFANGDILALGTAALIPASNQSALAPPPQPSVSFDVAAGAVANGTYRVVTTYVTPFGESLPSPEGVVTISGGPGEINVQSPPIVPGATGFNVYVTAAAGGAGTETKQVTVPASPVPIGTQAQNRATGVGAAPPVANTTAGPAPAAAVTAAAAGGALPAGSYLTRVTYVYQGGESAPSAAQGAAVVIAGAPGNATLAVTSPAAQAGATGYNVYVTKPNGAEGTEIRQNATPILVGTNFNVTALATQGVQKASANQSNNIVGLALSDSAANYGGYLGGTVKTSAAADAFLLGATTVGTPLTPAENANAQGFYFHGGQEVEMSLPATVVYADGILGQRFGLSIDATSGFFVADPTQLNQVGTIYDKALGPGKGIEGDTGARVKVRFDIAGVLAL